MGALPRKRALELACSVGCDSEPRGHLHSVSTFEAIDVIKKATEHLAAADPRLAGLIAAFGPPERLIAKDTCCFRSLAKSILYQQLAGTAAAAIYSRFLAVCKVPDESHLTPVAVLSASPAALRGCGLSERKASYLQDLAAHFSDGRLSDELLTSLPDDILLPTLTAVRGIGPWTVDMFSMFHLGRPDILPVGDLAVRKGIAHICGLSHLPSPAEMEQLTAVWRPYRSLGSYYMWRIPLPPHRASAAAGRGGKASSGRGGKKAQAARVKPAAAIPSPLPATVVAIADVGLNGLVPESAAGSGFSVTVVAGTLGTGADSIAEPDDVTCGADASTGSIEQQQLMLPPPTTPAKQQVVRLPRTPAAEQGTPNAVMSQPRARQDSSASVVSDAVTSLSTATTVPVRDGMMTRRRVRQIRHNNMRPQVLDSTPKHVGI